MKLDPTQYSGTFRFPDGREFSVIIGRDEDLGWVGSVTFHAIGAQPEKVIEVLAKEAEAFLQCLQTDPSTDRAPSPPEGSTTFGLLR